MLNRSASTAQSGEIRSKPSASRFARFDARTLDRFAASTQSTFPMATRLAILCPGQGTQHKEMFEIAFREGAIAERAHSWIADSLFGLSLHQALADSALLFANPVAQPLITAATLANWELIRPHLPAPSLVAGYSVGEIAACAVAGALPSSDAVRLAALRGQMMQACTDPGTHVAPLTIPQASANAGDERNPFPERVHEDHGATQAMLSIGGLPLAVTEMLARQFGLFIAIETGDDTCIVGGLRTQALLLDAQARRQGARTGLLPIGIASHTPLMAPAVPGFQGALSRIPLTDPVFPLLAGVSAEVVGTAANIRRTLSRQLTHRIHWTACMDACAERGITVALELGPGSALSRMMQARHPHIETRSVADFRTLPGIRRWIEQRLSS